jgi:hypothetical protein
MKGRNVSNNERGRGWVCSIRGVYTSIAKKTGRLAQAENTMTGTHKCPVLKLCQGAIELDFSDQSHESTHLHLELFAFPLHHVCLQWHEEAENARTYMENQKLLLKR